MVFFTEIEKKNPKICMEPQKSPNSQKVFLRIKNKAEGITLTNDFKLYNKAIVIKTV